MILKFQKPLLPYQNRELMQTGKEPMNELSKMETLKKAHVEINGKKRIISRTIK